MHAIFAILLLSLGAADVYRWTDADGQTHYTDRPQPGAELVTIDVGPSRPDGGASPSSNTRAPDDATEPPVFSYQSLTITTPAQEQVLWNIEGQLNVSAAVQPALRPGHALQFYLDGQMAQAEAGRTQTQYLEVFRGEHSLRAEVVDEQGKTLITSPTSRFFVRQTALPNPVPARP